MIPKLRNQLLATGVALAAAAGPAAAGETPSLEALWKMVRAQQKEIRALRAANRELAERLEATGALVERQAAAAPAAASSAPTAGYHGGDGRTTVGGYGELHYNNLDSKKEIDFHRFVLFLGHEFNERIRFNSELEVEHALAGGDEPGEVELEQAYVEFDLNPRLAARGGLFLVPVGILNETHEPNTFFGVERNPVESNILPTTWWEAGAALTGRSEATGLSWDLALTSGLKVPTDTYNIRKGRQKVAKAVAENPAFTGRLKWTGRPGVELAATVQYQDDLTQGQGPAGSRSSATLVETHAAIRRGPFGLRALYARWDLNGNGPKAVGADEQYGWYVEPAYYVNDRLGVFARYAEWDNTAGSAADTRFNQTNLGLNYWPHENVVLKFDIVSRGGAGDDDGFNLGIGYMF